MDIFTYLSLNLLKSVNDILEELQTNRKYSSEYGRHPVKLLRSQITNLVNLLETPKLVDKQEAPSPNLMNNNLSVVKNSNNQHL